MGKEKEKEKPLLWSPVKQFVEVAHKLHRRAWVPLIADGSDPD